MVFFINKVRFKEELAIKILFKIINIFEKVVLLEEIILDLRFCEVKSKKASLDRKPFLVRIVRLSPALMFSQRKFLIVNCFQIMYHKINYIYEKTMRYNEKNFRT